MGRYFKTATPQSLDFMYKLPENLMFQVAKQASDDISENQAAIYDLYGKLKLPAIENDKEAARKLLGKYEEKINGLSETLANNPLEFRRKSGEIMGLAREMSKDFSTGEAANIMNRYNTLNEWEKRQHENKDIKDKESINAMKAYALAMDRKAGGLRYNPVTGAAASLPLEELYGTVDMNKQFMERADKIVAQITASGGADSDGKYIYTWKNKTERRTPEQIRQVLYDDFLADEGTRNYIHQRSKIGTLHNWTDEKGNLILPTLQEVKDKTGKVIGQKEVWPQESALKSLVDANIGRYQLLNVDNTRSMKSDSAYATDMSFRTKTTVVDMKTGVQKVNPLGVDPTSTTPYEDVQKKIETLRAAGVGMFDQTHTNFANTILGIPTTAKITPTQRKELVRLSEEATELAKTNGDFSAYKKVYEKAAEYGVMIGTQDYKNTIEGIETNVRNSKNLESQLTSYQEMAKQALQKTGGYTDADLRKKTNELMASDVNNQHVTVNSTSGDIFADPADRTIYRESLKQIGQEFANGRIPDWAIIAEKKPDGSIVNTRVTGSDLKKNRYYQDFMLRERQPATTISTNQYGGTQQSTSVEDKDNEAKRPLAQKVFQDIAYKDNNGNTVTVTDPFEIQLSDNVIMYVDKDKYSSSEMDAIERKNRQNIDVSAAIQDAIVKAQSIKAVAEKAGVAPVYKSFEILGNDITFTPNGGKGVITVVDNGISYTKPSDDEQIRAKIHEVINKK